MEISFIGAGNLAWHLAPALENAGHHINEVYSRQLAHARQLVSNLYDAHTHSDLNLADSNSRLFVLAVPDDAIDTVCQRLVLPENALLIHTSGSMSLASLKNWMNVYSDVAVRTGVLYAPQTFTKNQPFMSFEGIPICVEASDTATEERLVDLAQQLSDTVYLLPSPERRTLHLAAVFAANFTNHLLSISHGLITDLGLSFEILHPLIGETVRKALAADTPANVQTGPARRGDLSTIESQLSLLSSQPALSEIYQVLTSSIQRQYT